MHNGSGSGVLDRDESLRRRLSAQQVICEPHRHRWSSEEGAASHSGTIRRPRMSDTTDQTQVKPDSTPTTPGAPTSVTNTEPEDHYVSGGQGKQQRKELEKSVKEGQRQPPVEQSPGLHRSGSYTGTAGGPEHTERDPAPKIGPLVAASRGCANPARSDAVPCARHRTIVLTAQPPCPIERPRVSDWTAFRSRLIQERRHLAPDCVRR